jgi:hypothetical protein
MAVTVTRKFSTRVRKRITAISQGLSEILAGVAEPAMRYATIYMALATGLPSINYAPLFGFCEGLVIALPEFVLIGAFSIAENAWKEGGKSQRAWAVVLFVACALLALVVGLTFVDIFIVKFSEFDMKLLNFSRCIIAVSFSIILGKLDGSKSEDEQQALTVQPVQNAASLNIQPIQTPAPPVHIEEIDKLTEEVNRLSALMVQMSQTVNVYISQSDMYRQIDSNIQREQQTYTPIDTPVQLALNEPATVVISEIDMTQAESTQATTEPPQAQIATYPQVEGIAADVVKLVIDEHLTGTGWTAISAKLGKNYSRVVKPIRDAYTQTCTPAQQA